VRALLLRVTDALLCHGRLLLIDAWHSRNARSMTSEPLPLESHPVGADRILTPLGQFCVNVNTKSPPGLSAAVENVIDILKRFEPLVDDSRNSCILH
jgi:hypothetical protein